MERCFDIEENADVKLKLKGVDADKYEDIEFGHVFPEESKSVNDLFNDYLVDAPKWYCKKVVKTKSLKNFPEIKFQAVFFVEGTKVKYSYNNMIRRPGYSAPEGAHIRFKIDMGYGFVKIIWQSSEKMIGLHQKVPNIRSCMLL